VSLQGGIGGFTGNASDVTTDIARSYGAMIGYHQFPFLTYELGYTGNTNSITGPTAPELEPGPGGHQGRPQLAARRVGGPTCTRPGGQLPRRGGNKRRRGGTAASRGDPGRRRGGPAAQLAGARRRPRRLNWNPGVGGSAGVVSDHPSSWQAGLTAAAVF
jgi:hypothetical protein